MKQMTIFKFKCISYNFFRLSKHNISANVANSTILIKSVYYFLHCKCDIMQNKLHYKNT